MTRREIGYDEYVSDAKKLIMIQDELSEIGIRLADTESKNSPVSRNLFKASELIRQVRSDQEDRFARDYPQKFDVHIFYP